MSSETITQGENETLENFNSRKRGLSSHEAHMAQAKIDYEARAHLPEWNIPPTKTVTTHTTRASLFKTLRQSMSFLEDMPAHIVREGGVYTLTTWRVEHTTYNMGDAPIGMRAEVDGVEYGYVSLSSETREMVIRNTRSFLNQSKNVKLLVGTHDFNWVISEAITPVINA